VTPRGTDWSLAFVVTLGFATGVLTIFAGGRGDAWVFAVHGVAGTSLGLLLGWKFRRVWRRVFERRRWDRRTGVGILAGVLVATTLVSGWAWSSGADTGFAGYPLLVWHFVVGTGLAVVVVAHATFRARRPRRRDVIDRRQFLTAAGVAAGGLAAWQLQRPAAALVGFRGAKRRFTGSYEVASFEGNAFPTTSWVSDKPRELDPSHYRLTVEGLVAEPTQLALADLGTGDGLVATLDCTGGFYSTQRWEGITLEHLLARAGGARRGASHVRVISHTGYRCSFGLDDARRFLLATTVGGEPLSHGHGAPVRLVAPGRRGFEWVKWVERVELHDGPDAGALASTLWSSFTREGRGAA
jgi:DMSO/TMAO reductase YedYZ molybdopterin-dependent catalytic subunit